MSRRDAKRRGSGRYFDRAFTDAEFGRFYASNRRRLLVTCHDPPRLVLTWRGTWTDAARRHSVFLRDGKYLCVLCGKVVEIPEGKRTLVFIATASGQPNMRTITLDGRELHRCPLQPEKQ